VWANRQSLTPQLVVTRSSATHLVREDPANVAEVVAVDPVVGVDLHPAPERRDTLGANDGVGIAIAVDEDAVAKPTQRSVRSSESQELAQRGEA
jgi:hypothetical protein